MPFDLANITTVHHGPEIATAGIKDIRTAAAAATQPPLDFQFDECDFSQIAPPFDIKIERSAAASEDQFELTRQQKINDEAKKAIESSCGGHLVSNFEQPC